MPRSATASVYPRVCGGTIDTYCGWLKSVGLSPRVRGNLGQAVGAEPFRGSIPACAGEPMLGSRTKSRRTVYPRVCGGTASIIAMRRSRAGLSPRVRGNPGQPMPTPTPPRSIPACAGEPLLGDGVLSWKEVYPRVCGGTPASHDYSYAIRGLSPRVRGNRRLKVPGRQLYWSIPACAGEPRNSCPRCGRG